MAAVLAKGITEIRLAATEPHVVDLCQFLVKMGARINGIGTHTLLIDGQQKLHAVEYNIIPDQIESGTFALAMAVTSGSGIIHDFIIDHHDIFLKKLSEANVNYRILSRDTLEIKQTTKINPVKIRTDIYPGFPTDLQAPLESYDPGRRGYQSMRLLFEGRLIYLKELNKMAKGFCNPDSHEPPLPVQRPYKKSTINSLDLRAGATLIIATMLAEGKSTISNVGLIDRGYERLKLKF